MRLKIIIEADLDLLNRIRGSWLACDAGIDAMAEAFKFTDALNGHSVQNAVGAASARAAVTDPDLADLVRKEQDALKQIQVLQTALSNILAAPADQQISSVIKDLRKRSSHLGTARDVLLTEIKNRFPKYSDFINPRLVSVAKTQENLKPGEALISIHTSGDHTYVWAIPHTGKMKATVGTFGKREMNRMIAQIRKSLHPESGKVDDIPEFDLVNAHRLYRKVLQSVEEGWKKANDLLVVAHGPLGQLPFSVLVTATTYIRRDKHILFKNYRQGLCKNRIQFLHNPHGSGPTTKGAGLNRLCLAKAGDLFGCITGQLAQDLVGVRPKG